jgi:hypothetical protein
MTADVRPYGVAIQQAIAKGDLREMKALAASTEKLLATSGNLSASLELLKVEVAKLKSKKK